MENTFYPLFVHLHSVIRWFLIVSLFASIGLAFLNYVKREALHSRGKLASKITVFLAHLQLLVGIILYWISPKVVFQPARWDDPLIRFFTMEHVTGMIIAILLITLGYFRMKKTSRPERTAALIFWYFLISLVIIGLMIPWPFMANGSRWI